LYVEEREGRRCERRMRLLIRLDRVAVVSRGQASKQAQRDTIGDKIHGAVTQQHQHTAGMRRIERDVVAQVQTPRPAQSPPLGQLLAFRLTPQRIVVC
jgi:hypothetical protein